MVFVINPGLLGQAGTVGAELPSKNEEKEIQDRLAKLNAI
jgi:hypothetical protein